jgi:hypothetical protein
MDVLVVNYMAGGITVALVSLVVAHALRGVDPLSGRSRQIEIHDGVKMVGTLLTTWFVLLASALVMTGWASHGDHTHLLPEATYVAATVFGAVFAAWPAMSGLSLTRWHAAAMVLFGALIGWAVGTAWLLRRGA